MNKKVIDQLLKKYWDAESSLEEERTLSDYFIGGNVDPSHVQYAPLFSFYNQEKKDITTDLDIDKINFDAEEEKTGYGHFNLSPMKMGLAASFILFFAYLGGLNISDTHSMNDYASNVVIYDEDKEMQEAYEVTKQALAMLSSKLKSSQKTVSENMNEIKKVDLRN